LAATEPLALYVHWPFCRAKCPYCDFNSHVRAAIDEARWRAALLAELEATAAGLGPRRLETIFFGGGTPSLMAPETAGALIERARRLFEAAPDLEITLEANPTSVEAGRLAAFRDAGVNRVSLGVQALEPQALRFLGRQHGVDEALAALETAGRLFARVSFDLIYARPGQGVADWRAELARALGLARGHLSLYQLSLERGTPFFAAARAGAFALPDEDTALALYQATEELTAAAGLPAYEVSNHAAPGEACRHNLAYWRYQDYAGIGPGAHGRLVLADGRAVATRRHAQPEAWLAAVEARGAGSAEVAPLAPRERAEEMVMMGLRLSEGLDLTRLAARTGLALDALAPQERRAALVDAGLLVEEPDRLRATPRGRAVLSALTGALLA
jgi:oxygen-independent coproporphyrinogen-3 oxidase